LCGVLYVDWHKQASNYRTLKHSSLLGYDWSYSRTLETSSTPLWAPQNPILSAYTFHSISSITY